MCRVTIGRAEVGADYCYVRGGAGKQVLPIDESASPRLRLDSERRARHSLAEPAQRSENLRRGLRTEDLKVGMKQIARHTADGAARWPAGAALWRR